VLVEVARSGGFAGRTRRAVIDTATLPADRATALCRLVGELSGLPPHDGPAHPDRYQYELTVDGKPGPSLPEQAIPAALRAELDRLLTG
jgi:Emfourin